MQDELIFDKTAAVGLIGSQPPPADPPVADTTQSDPDDHELIHHLAENAYLQYALAVVKGRALPAVDGQKPVQRRTLYSMHRMGFDSTSKPVKSARIVGDVLGKYHPHGDTSCYDAMVRIAQPFSLRYPLVQGQGNFGSLDGDGAAAMRYTEARLSLIADLLLRELDSGTVDFVPNYDGSEQEPSLLPARLPFTLLNGASGIAVGMAGAIAPHNLREVAAAAALMVEKPDTTLDELLVHIQGPDFPGGGQLISSRSEIEAAYRTGRQPLRCRARWVKEDLAKGAWQIVVTELPYQVSARAILESIDTLTNPQIPKDKKAISQVQANLKQIALEFLEKAGDESDKNQATRLVLVPRSSKVDPDAMMAFLLANTDLETSVAFNWTMIGLDGRPATKGLVAVLGEWASFRVGTVRRRTQHELDIALRRLHILEGRMTVFLNLDRVIHTIRFAEEPRSELMETFTLSEEQATDILEIRLRQLNRLEGIKIERERDGLLLESARLRELLADEGKLRAMIVTEIRADASKHGDDRRTLIESAERITVASAAVRNVPDEEVTVVVSKNLWVKSYRGHRLAAESFGFKPGDSLLAGIDTKTVGSVYILDSKGRAYQIDAGAVPGGRGDGAPLSSFIDLQTSARVAAVLGGSPEQAYLFGGVNGNGFQAPLKSLASRQKAGKAFLVLGENEAPFQPVLLPASPENSYLVLGSTGGKMLAVPPAEVKVLANGGQGVVLMALEEGETLSAVLHATVSQEKPFTATVEVPGKGRLDVKLVGDEWEKHVGHRARKGAFLPKKGVLLA